VADPTPASIADLVRRCMEMSRNHPVVYPDDRAVVLMLSEVASALGALAREREELKRSAVPNEAHAFVSADRDALRAELADRTGERDAYMTRYAQANARISSLEVQLAEREHFHKINRDGFVAITNRAQELEKEDATLREAESEARGYARDMEAENRQLALDLQAAEARASGAEAKARERDLWAERAWRLAKTWREIIEEDGVDHDDPDCPQDDTCRCENVAKINAAFGNDSLGMTKVAP